MRILNNDNQLSIKNISVFLTNEEAQELRDTIEQLIENSDKGSYHLHLNDKDFKHEITFSVYSDKDVSLYNARTQRLLIDDV